MDQPGTVVPGTVDAVQEGGGQIWDSVGIKDTFPFHSFNINASDLVEHS